MVKLHFHLSDSVSRFTEGTYLVNQFGQNHGAFRSALHDPMICIERVQPSFQFERRAAALAVPVPPAEGSTEEIVLQPWMLGFGPDFSFKGTSKSVYVLRLVQEFLEVPYHSVKNPIGVSFKNLNPGSNIDPFSVTITNGYTKIIAMKLILVAAIDVSLTDAELKSLYPFLAACYGFRCVHKTSGDAKADQFNCLAEKFSESSRPRPDPIQCAFMFRQMRRVKLGMRGLVSLSRSSMVAVAGNTRRFQPWRPVIKMYPTLHQATQDLVAYHWSNFESKTSALTLKIIGSEVLRPLAILDGIFSFQVQKLCCV